MKRNLPIQARIPMHIIFHPSLLSLIFFFFFSFFLSAPRALPRVAFSPW